MAKVHHPTNTTGVKVPVVEELVCRETGERMLMTGDTLLLQKWMQEADSWMKVDGSNCFLYVFKGQPIRVLFNPCMPDTNK